MTKEQEILIVLLSNALGGEQIPPNASAINWHDVVELSRKQEVGAIAFDGYQMIHKSLAKNELAKSLLLEWLGQSLFLEKQYKTQFDLAVKLAELYDNNHIATYVLKGFSISCCYPNPFHRFSCDLDCFLTTRDPKQNFDAYSLGNSIIEARGLLVNRDYYKHSEFCFYGLNVENHRFCCSVKRGKRTKELENYLQQMIKEGKRTLLPNSKLVLPPLLFQALFLLEHACGHFLYEKMTLKHLCDWAMFRKHYQADLKWDDFDILCNRFGLKNFEKCLNHLADFILGIISYTQLSSLDRRVLEDTFKEISVTKDKKTQRFRKAMNVLRSRWKFHYFNDVCMIQELLHSFWGFLFKKDVEL